MRGTDMKHEDERQPGSPIKDRVGLTRRQMLKTFATGIVAAAADATFTRECASSGAPVACESAAPGGVKKAVTTYAAAFALADVRLLDGPFLRAQQRDARYLLQLEPDRLLHNFRVNAGLKPKAPVYGGWESVEPWIAIRCHGHTLGHYLSACSFMFAATGDQRFRQRADYIVTELRDCQDVGKSGLVCAFPDGDAPLGKAQTNPL